MVGHTLAGPDAGACGLVEIARSTQVARTRVQRRVWGFILDWMVCQNGII